MYFTSGYCDKLTQMLYSRMLRQVSTFAILPCFETSKHICFTHGYCDKFTHVFYCRLLRPVHPCVLLPVIATSSPMCVIAGYCDQFTHVVYCRLLRPVHPCSLLHVFCDQCLLTLLLEQILTDTPLCIPITSLNHSVFCSCTDK